MEKITKETELCIRFLILSISYLISILTSQLLCGHQEKKPKLSRTWELNDRKELNGLDDMDRKRGGTGRERVTNEGKSDSGYKDKSETYLVVATLLATFTFAAALTLSGGYVTDKGPDLGTPVLMKSKAFKVFIVADIISLLLSSFAVFIHFRIVEIKRKRRLHAVMVEAFNATYDALIAMVVAFPASAYAVLSPSSSWLAALCYIIPLVFAYILMTIFEFFK